MMRYWPRLSLVAVSRLESKSSSSTALFFPASSTIVSASRRLARSRSNPGSPDSFAERSESSARSRSSALLEAESETEQEAEWEEESEAPPEAPAGETFG